MQQTSKWEKHLPYLHVGTLRVYNSVSENYKNSKKIPVMRKSWVLWKDPKSLPLGPRSHECDNKQTKS